jgi:hypothetical protein
MKALDLDSASLFRLLSKLFGKDQVVFGMSLYLVCGGEFPQDTPEGDVLFARSRYCHFTVLDPADAPRLVIELLPRIDDVIEASRYEKQGFLEDSLRSIGIHYITLSAEELDLALDPTSGVDVCAILSAKVMNDGGVSAISSE